ncbi:hypothetical protein C0J52_02654 [Blattella germanica]|nr:hypothetical protein C0J52_02654 [Blattella germanica]
MLCACSWWEEAFGGNFVVSPAAFARTWETLVLFIEARRNALFIKCCFGAAKVMIDLGLHKLFNPCEQDLDWC